MNNEQTVVTNKRLGRLPARASRKALMFADFITIIDLPDATSYWRNKPPLPIRTFGNLQYGSCTRSSQAYGIMRMERREQRRTVNITDEEVVRVYMDMSERYYGGGDNGAYMEDALNDWRKPEYTIRDVDGHPYTIDAYLRINPFNHRELKAAIALAGAKGVPVALNLPRAWAKVEPPQDWTIPAGQPAIDAYLPGSWGGHAMWAFEYDKTGIWVDHTWMLAPQRITWEACSVYLDEAFVVLDSVNEWRRRLAAEPQVSELHLLEVIDAVNIVSSYPIRV